MSSDLTRIAEALERIAAALEAAVPTISSALPKSGPALSPPVDGGNPQSKSAALRAEHERLDQLVQEARASGASRETLRQLRSQRWHAARAASEQEEKDREKKNVERERWRRRVLTDVELAEYERLEAVSHAAFEVLFGNRFDDRSRRKTRTRAEHAKAYERWTAAYQAVQRFEQEHGFNFDPE